MSFQEIIDKIKPDLENLMENFKKKILKIHSSSLYPSLIEDIEIEFAGNKMPLKRLGSVNLVSGREILIHPWDKSYIEPITKAIERSNFDLSVFIEKETIKVAVPPLTQQYRQSLIRRIEEMVNETFQSIRKIRDKAWKELQEGCRRGEIREDDKYKGKEKLENIIKEYRERIEQLVQRKKEEIKG